MKKDVQKTKYMPIVPSCIIHMHVLTAITERAHNENLHISLNIPDMMFFPAFLFVLALVSAVNPFQFHTGQNAFLSHFGEAVGFSGLTDYVVDSQYSLLELHRSLVQISSISNNELEVGKWLGKYLQNAGFTVELQKVDEENERYNVYAFLGDKRDTTVVVTSHIDTVPPYLPYFVNGTQIHGRGTCDAKGSVATQVIAVLEMVSQGILQEGQVSLLFVVGEENSGSGMRKVADSLDASWDIAIFGEPTENKLAIGHKGIVLFDVEVFGQASHSGYPELGISATEILVPLLAKLQALDLPQSDLLGPSTLNIGRIEAGVAANVVPAYAKATLAIRVADQLGQVIGLLRSVVEGVPHVIPSDFFATEPQFLDTDVPGFDTLVAAYTTDVPNLTVPLKKRYLFGPGTIHVAHGANEYVENGDLLEAIAGYKKLIEYSLSQK